MGGIRYIQRPGAVGTLGVEVERLGAKCFVIGGAESYRPLEEAIHSSLIEQGIVSSVALHSGKPTRQAARYFARKALAQGCDVIVGVGGGSVADLAKTVADDGGFPLVEVPTSTATFAAATRYADLFDVDGAHSEHVRCDVCAHTVIADEDVLARQPERHIAAGALAAMAEINAAYPPADGDTKAGGATAASRKSARLDSGFLETFAIPACRDAKEGCTGAPLSKVIVTSLAVAGLAASDAPGAGRSDLAHRVFDGIVQCAPDCASSFLYGELVGLGMLVQEEYSGNSAEAKRLQAAMAKMKMPTTLRQLGIGEESSQVEALRAFVCACPCVPFDVKAQRHCKRAFEFIVR